MKPIFSLFLALLILQGCASKKNSATSDAERPVAEVPLAPGQVLAKLNITEIKNVDNAKMITATVEEVMNYGSSTEPLNTGSVINFLLSDNMPDKLKNAFTVGKSINTLMSRENSGMMGEKASSSLWKLISIQ